MNHINQLLMEEGKTKDIQLEKNIIGSPDPVSLSCTKTILKQMKKCICKIKIDNTFGTGFFCKIHVENNKTMNCLMTCYHVLNEKYYDKNNQINLLLNDEEEIKVIDLTRERKTYFNKDYDITIIQLNDDDNIYNFLELDDRLKDDIIKLNETYKNTSIYIIQYLNGKKAAVSYGLLTEMDYNEIKHTCCTENGSSGSPILNLENNKVIGIHKAASSHKFNFNYGTLFKVLLNKINFKKKISNNCINDMIIDKSDSWLHIFEQTINNYDIEKIKKKIENKNKKIEKEINEIVKNKIQEIKCLHKRFKNFNGITEKSNSQYIPSLENILNIMTFSIIGLFAYDAKKNYINFTDIETLIKSRISKNLIIRNKCDYEKYLTERNEKFCFDVISLFWYYNEEKEYTYSISAFLNGWISWKTVAKMVSDNIFCYNTEEELDKVFENISTEIISDIKNKNNYKGKFNFSSGSLIDGNIIYKKVIDNFNNFLQKIIILSNKSSDNLEKYLKDFLKHDGMIYLKNFGVIYPIKYSSILKGGKIPWI